MLSFHQQSPCTDLAHSTKMSLDKAQQIASQWVWLDLYFWQAANNAANNQGASKSDLVVSECFVDVAGKYKRFQPRAKGR